MPLQVNDFTQYGALSIFFYVRRGPRSAIVVKIQVNLELEQIQGLEIDPQTTQAFHGLMTIPVYATRKTDSRKDK